SSCSVETPDRLSIGLVVIAIWPPSTDGGNRGQGRNQKIGNGRLPFAFAQILEALAPRSSSLNEKAIGLVSGFSYGTGGPFGRPLRSMPLRPEQELRHYRVNAQFEIKSVNSDERI